MTSSLAFNADDLLPPLGTITDDLKDLFDLDVQRSWPSVSGFEKNEASPDLRFLKGSYRLSSPGNFGMALRLVIRVTFTAFRKRKNVVGCSYLVKCPFDYLRG